MNNTITRIQLIPTAPDFISGYLDVDQSVPAPINYAISDVREPTSRTGSFSKNIVLPGTKNNNELLSYLFDVNTAEGTFKIKRLYKCYILQDNVPVTDNELNLQLLAVNKIQDNFTEDDIISYDVVVRDDVGQFFTSISNKNLQDLSFTELNHNINALTIVNSWNHQYSSGFPGPPVTQNYKYILPYKDNENAWWYYEPIVGIYARYYFDKIHNDAGFSYEFFNNQEPDYFNQLIIPSNRNKDELSEETKFENNIKLSYVAPTLPPNQLLYFTPATLVSGQYRIGVNQPRSALFPATAQLNNVIQDVLNQWTVPFTFTPLASTVNNFKVKVAFDYTFQIFNPSGVSIDVIPDNPNKPVLAATRFEFRNFPSPNGTINTVGVLSQSAIVQDTQGPIFPETTYPPGLSPAFGASLQRFEDEFIINNTTAGNNYFFNISTIFTEYHLRSANPFEVVLDVRNLTLEIEVTTPLLLNQNIDMNRTIPDIKQSDFLKSIYTMYNLYCVPDKFNSNRLVYYTRDDFYRNGNDLDWTLKLDRSSEQKLEFLPELRNRELQLSYKDDDDEANKFFKSYVGDTYGIYKYEFDIEWTKGIDRRELIFAPTPGGQNLFGTYLPFLETGKEPRILIDGGKLNTPIGTTILIINNIIGGFIPVGQLGLTQYPSMSHFNRPRNPTFDINFSFLPKPVPYYFYDIQIPTRNNLGNLFWANTVNQIQKGQLLTAYFWLTPTDIQGLNLNDRIRIDNSYWNINKIIDYDASQNKLTKVELITSSDLLPLPIIPPVEPEEPEEPEE